MTHDYPEIQPDEIRKGDLIRYEFGNMPDSASEWRAEVDGVSPYQARGGKHYLIDRPAPPVDLPTEPTLGWLTSTGNHHTLSTWRPRSLTGGMGIEPDLTIGFRALNHEVTAFTPATAVPTEALDKLRAERVVHTHGINGRAIAKFLEAVGEAQS